MGGYWKSLGRMYAGYSLIIVISTIFNYCMTTVWILPHYVAYVFTLLWTGIVSYFTLKHLWSFGGASNSSGTGSSGKTNVTPKAIGETSPTSGSFNNNKVRRTISRR